MTYFAWNINADLFSFLRGEGGVSDSYVVPHSQISGALAYQIAGSHIWIILNSKQGYLPFACVHVIQVEQFEEGYNSGDYLLSIDRANSFRVISDLSSEYAKPLKTSLNIDEGIVDISSEKYFEISREIKYRIGTNFRKPPESTIEKLILASNVILSKTRISRLISSATSRFPLDTLWASPAPLNLPAYANLAYLKIKQIYGVSIADDIAANLAKYDPTSDFNSSPPDQAAEINTEAEPPLVDVDLVYIDVKRIYARKFIAADKANVDRSASLEKTEKAEKLHQDMLRDIVSFLISKRIFPLHSSSIDMAIINKGNSTIFELKSANSHNLYHQTSAGIFQLLTYKDALMQGGQQIGNSVIILEMPMSPDCMEHIQRIATYANISVLFYDRDINWPDRLPGLLDLLQN